MKRTRRICDCGCGKRFTPHVATQKYIDSTHAKHAANRLAREKSKRLSVELGAPLYGDGPKDEAQEREWTAAIYAEAERIRLARTFQPHPVGYPYQPAEVLEYHDGVRRGRG